MAASEYKIRAHCNPRGKLAARGDIPSVDTDALLYCPDYTVRTPETAGLVLHEASAARLLERFY